MLQTIEVRPNVNKNAALLGIGCAVFSLGALGMIASGEAVFAGLLCLIFFGGGGLYAIPKMLRRPVTMVIAAQRIELRYAEGSAYIRWSDIEKVGITSMFSNKMVGVRLKSYDYYLEHMSPSLAKFMTKNLPYMKLLTKATSMLDVPQMVSLWSELEGRDISETLSSFGKVGDLAQGHMWARKNTGYDIVFAWSEIDRPPSDFAALLEKYWHSAKQNVG